MSPGRPTRFAWYVHSSAMSLRWQRGIASGVTIVAIERQHLAAGGLALGGEQARLAVGEPQALPAELLLRTRVSASR